MINPEKAMESVIPSAEDDSTSPPSYDHSHPTFIASSDGPASSNINYESQLVPIQLVHIQTIGMISPATVVASEMEKINDHMGWSLLNVCVGGVVLGLLGILLSNSIREKKRSGDLEGAKSLSYWTAIWNTFSTLGGITINITVIICLINYYKDK